MRIWEQICYLQGNCEIDYQLKYLRHCTGDSHSAGILRAAQDDTKSRASFKSVANIASRVILAG